MSYQQRCPCSQHLWHAAALSGALVQMFVQLSCKLPQEVVCPEKMMLGGKGEMVNCGLFYKVRSLP